MTTTDSQHSAVFPPALPVRLSVVMPAYNEEGAIAGAIDDVRRHVFAVVPDAELIVVNDGSKDRTGALLDELAAAEPRLRPVHQANAGHGPAIWRGMSEARGEWVLLIDSDRQIPLEHFAAAWRAVQAGDVTATGNAAAAATRGVRGSRGAQGVDACFGERRRRADHRFRRGLTMVIRGVVSVLFFVPARDLNVPFKLFRRELFESSRRLIPPTTLAPSLFLAIIALRTRRVAVVEVEHRDRATGVVSIRRWKLVKFCLRGLRQLLTFRVRTLGKLGRRARTDENVGRDLDANRA